MEKRTKAVFIIMLILIAGLGALTVYNTVQLVKIQDKVGETITDSEKIDSNPSKTDTVSNNAEGMQPLLGRRDADIVIEDGAIYLKFRNLNVNAILDAISDKIEQERAICEKAGKDFSISMVELNDSRHGIRKEIKDYDSNIVIRLCDDNPDMRYRFIKGNGYSGGGFYIIIRFGESSYTSSIYILPESAEEDLAERIEYYAMDAIGVFYLPSELKQ